MKIWLCLLLFSFSVSARAEFNCEQMKEILHDGDIVFIDVDSFIFRQVAIATHTWADHVGIAMRINGEWKIMESRVPFSQVSNLCDFVQKRSKNQYYSVRRLPVALSGDQVAALRRAAEQRMAQPYNFGFNYDGWGEYCSKFVYDSYLQALGIEVGKMETVGELISKYPKQSITFWKIWFRGNIPMNQRLVTPASIFFNPDLVTVDQQGPLVGQ